MKIVYFGNGIRGLKCLEASVGAKVNVVAVVGHPGNKSDVVKYAEETGITTYQPVKVNSDDFVEGLRKLEAQLFILSGYNRILKSDIINVPTKGCINLHGGKLPEYRGCAPINWQIINGETIGGCCILFVDEGIDTGDIIEQQYYEITEADTSQDVVNKQLNLFPPMLLKVVADFKAGAVRAKPQDKNKGCYYTRRYPRDGSINWETMTATEVYNLVRALVDPYPNAFTFCQGRKVRIRRTQKIFPPVKGVPGRLPLKMADGVIICCKDEGILVTEVGLDDDNSICNPCDVFKIGIDFG